MDLKDDVELANTQFKLARLEARYEEAKNRPCENARLREATMRSLKGTINQFKEEIVRYLAHRPVQPCADVQKDCESSNAGDANSDPNARVAKR